VWFLDVEMLFEKILGSALGNCLV